MAKPTDDLLRTWIGLGAGFRSGGAGGIGQQLVVAAAKRSIRLDLGSSIIRKIVLVWDRDRPGGPVNALIETYPLHMRVVVCRTARTRLIAGGEHALRM